MKPQRLADRLTQLKSKLSFSGIGLPEDMRSALDTPLALRTWLWSLSRTSYLTARALGTVLLRGLLVLIVSILRRGEEQPQCRLIPWVTGEVTDRYFAEIWFDIPSHPITWLGNAIFTQTVYSHCRLLLIDNEEGYTHHVELTWDGTICEKYRGISLELTQNKLGYVIPLNEGYFKRMISKSYEIASFNPRWSNWYILSYLAKGTFPSFNCASIISFIMWNTTDYDLPHKIIEKLEYDKERADRELQNRLSQMRE